jgi:sugar (pentulose or hexulose) kinase
MDQRLLGPHPAGASFAQVLAERLGPETRGVLGNELRPGLPIGTLFWLVETQRHAGLDGAIPLTMADYALMRLCDAPPGVELTNAAATGLLDVRTSTWHRPALAALGLERLDWPAITPLTQPAGAYPYQGRSIPAYRAVGDAQCSLVGAGLAAGELSINIATGSQVSLIQDTPAPGPFQIRPFFDRRWLLSLVGLPAGRSLNVLVGLLTELAGAAATPVKDPWTALLALAEQAPGTDLGVNLAFFAGAEGAPGSIERITEGNLSAGGLFRAAFRQMAENYYAAASRLAPGRDWGRLVITGGLARQSVLLRDLIARRFAAEYRLGPDEDALMGLLTLALVCAGRASSVAAASQLVHASAGEATP